MGTLAIARTSLLAVLTLGLWLGLGEGLASDVAPGATDPARNGGLDLTTHHSVVVDGIPGARGSLREVCPAGQVVAGGFSHVGSGLHVTESRPDGIYAWRISWIQTSTDDSVLYAYAVCLSADE
jgi:hypothetical protein